MKTTRTFSNSIGSMSDIDKKLLELLSTGASGKGIAEALGYKEGTTRVYLHNLYQRIGVKNKISAVNWYKAQIGEVPRVPGASPVVPEAILKSFGDIALRAGLRASLGVMEVFLGPYSRTWEISNLLSPNQGPSVSENAHQNSAVVRQLWSSILDGDFAEGKRRYDEGLLQKLFISGPSDAVPLAVLLGLGEYSSNASAAIHALPAKSMKNAGITADEHDMLEAVLVSFSKRAQEGIDILKGLAARKQTSPALRHLVCACLFHIYRKHSQRDLARDIANSLWADAEAIRGNLESVGDKLLVQDLHRFSIGHESAAKPISARQPEEAEHS
jgi:DNA-binding CsgD family transcriptional regulator